MLYSPLLIVLRDNCYINIMFYFASNKPIFLDIREVELNHVSFLGDFNFKDIAWPDRLNKSGSMLSQSEGQMLIDIMHEHGLDQLVHFPTREKNTLDLILTSLPGQFQEIHSPDKLSDHDVISVTLKVYIPPPPSKKERRRGRCIYIRKEILCR